MRPRARAVLFDMDGVLLDSFHTWLGVLNEVASQLGAVAISAAQLQQAFGQGIEEDAVAWFGGADVARLGAAYDECLPRHLDALRPNPEAGAVLADLRNRGVGTAIVTNTPPGLAAAMLAVVGLEGAADCVAAASDDLRGKPHPDLLTHALAELGLPASQAVMLGDTDYDERAARGAGVAYVRYEIRGGASLGEAVEAALDGDAVS